MASSAPLPPYEMLVTLKVNFDGSGRRFKLPLREMGVHLLETNLRKLLTISCEDEIVVERYSDSASTYVVLDPNNIPVYKQLYRAAKAKQKLKLRVSIKKVAKNKKPKPASVEDDIGAEETPPVEARDGFQPKTEGHGKLVSLPSPGAPTQHKPASRSHAASEASHPIETLQDRVCEQLNRLNLESQHRNEDHLSRLILESQHCNKILEGRLSRLNLESRHRNDFQASIKALDQIQTKLANTMSPERRSAAVASPVTSSVPATSTRINYSVCCNSCDRAVPGAHYHCSICDDGDFDLCQECLDQGIGCHSTGHWLIKRIVQNGSIINSTTERLASRSKPKPQSETEQSSSHPLLRTASPGAAEHDLHSHLSEFSVQVTPPGPGPFHECHERTCNSCVQDLPEDQFLHCTTCEDFDLCKTCIANNQHGHHPKHGFIPVVEGTDMPAHINQHLAPGRNQAHNAICDGCDNDIKGIRHKCLDCPDWDYCTNCVVDAALKHPGHRFVPVYEPLESARDIRIRSYSKSTHYGICCDGSLCSSSRNTPKYIVGDRYKCAVCHDLDFCANCEASPSNAHNRTHPLIKFKTPVRSVSVTTTGEHENGLSMPPMGDRSVSRNSFTSSRATETSAQVSIATDVRTVVDVHPSEPTSPVKVEADGMKMGTIPAVEASSPEALDAVFVRDTISDGTSFAPNHVFEQTWVLRNAGRIAWPAGCSVRFVGGDYMGHVDPAHPAAVADIVASSESTVCLAPVLPGDQISFSVLLRTPNRGGRSISNWRLSTKDGLRFGHRLWCDVMVEKPAVTHFIPSLALKEHEVTVKENGASAFKVAESQMIFPKLEKESPVGSIHEAHSHTLSAPVDVEEEYEDCDDVDEWDQSEDGFMTDEEYDILDASDEEVIEKQHKVLKK